MKPLILVFTLILALTFGSSGHSEPKDASLHFKDALQWFNSGEFEKAEAEFLSALQLDGKNPDILSNLGVVSAKKGELGKAAGYFYSALSIDPDQSTAELGLQFVQEKMEVKELPHRLSLKESLISGVISKINPELLIGFIAIISLLFFLRLIDLIKARKLADRTESERPSPSWILWLSGTVLIFLLCLGGGKLLERIERRGIILPKKVAALSAPDSNAVEMFDLYEGLQVVINGAQGDWIQVTYPGGQTGWVMKKDVFVVLK